MRQADITIPYAIADFAILREYGYYYVDKTRYISLLERYSAPVFLRPRRFGKSLGKSLFISTLAYYYDLNEAGRFDSLFGGTYIGSHPTGEQNKYMVLRLDFSKMVVADNLKELERNFNKIFAPDLKGFAESSYRYARFLKDFTFSDDKDVTVMLSNIVSYISNHNPTRCMRR